jgi:hypothetical protein
MLAVLVSMLAPTIGGTPDLVWRYITELTQAENANDLKQISG